MKHYINTLLVLAAAVLIGLPLTAQAQQSHTEDFTTTTYEDAVNTTADWNTANGELKLYPFVPSLVGSHDTPAGAGDIAVSGDLAFVADGTSGLQVIDITDPTNPDPLGSFNTAGTARGVADV